MLKIRALRQGVDDFLVKDKDFGNHDVARFITLIEPVILVIMGIVIAAVVLALYMPLFQLSTVVSR